jgi:hypothetical protein
MSKLAPQGTLNVYEVVNYGRRESLIALVADGLAPLVHRLGPPRPQPIAHWEPAETFVVEQLAAAMPIADAEAFAKLFLSNVRWAGWKTLFWRG